MYLASIFITPLILIIPIAFEGNERRSDDDCQVVDGYSVYDSFFLRPTPSNENGSGSRSDSQAENKKSLSMGVAARVHFHVCVRLKNNDWCP